MSKRTFNRLILQILPHIVAIAVLSLTVRLAFWQLDRAADKEVLLERWSQSETIRLGAKPISAIPDLSEVSATGHFDTRRHILLDNQTRNNHPGVHVYSLFTPSNGAPPVLVNRGWQPWMRTDGQWPEFVTPEVTVTLSGRLKPPPQPGLMLGEALPLDPDQWPNLMTYLDIGKVKAVFGDELADRIVLLDPQHPAHLSGDEWPRVNMTPERHRGYAFQWAAISLAVLILWLGLTIRFLIKKRRAGSAPRT